MDEQRLKELKAKSRSVVDDPDTARYMPVLYRSAEEALELIGEIERLKAERPLAEGDKIVITDKVPESSIYPWVKAGAVGVIETVLPTHDYPYRVRFEGKHVVDPTGCPVVVKNPLLFLNREEIELA